MSKTFQESPVRLQSTDQLLQAEKTFYKNQKIIISCNNCNKDFVQRLGYLIKQNNFVCKNCKISKARKNWKTNIDSFAHTKIATEQELQNFCKDYGKLNQIVDCECTKCQKVFSKKARFITFPLLCGSCSRIVKQEAYLSSRTEVDKREAVLRREETNLKKYGYKYAMQDANKKSQIVETFNERYGNFYDFIHKKFQEKYMVENPSQVQSVQSKRHRKVVYENLTFDSNLELDFYKYLVSKGLVLGKDFEMQKKYPKTYTGWKSKEHFTFVDFYLIATGTWIECKGKHFFDKNGEAKLVYGEKSEKYKDLYKARLYNWKSKLSFLRAEKIKIVTEEADFDSVFEHLEK